MKETIIRLLNEHYEIFMLTNNHRESVLMAGAYLKGTINILCRFQQITEAQKDKQIYLIDEITEELMDDENISV